MVIFAKRCRLVTFLRRCRVINRYICNVKSLPVEVKKKREVFVGVIVFTARKRGDFFLHEYSIVLINIYVLVYPRLN
jgi:hypothetical protein